MSILALALTLVWMALYYYCKHRYDQLEEKFLAFVVEQVAVKHADDCPCKFCQEWNREGHEMGCWTGEGQLPQYPTFLPEKDAP